MLVAFEILTILLVAVAVATSMAHALEPGKRRLAEETYRAVQTIYYPGFTVAGGIGDFGGMLATLVLPWLMPTWHIAFWLSLAAFLALVVVNGIYWIVVHPVNKVWISGVETSPAAKRFFSTAASKDPAGVQTADWTSLRDRWEWAHVARAAFALLGLALLTAAVALAPR